MSKPIKKLISQEYTKRFGSLEGAVLIDIRGTRSNGMNKLRAGLAPHKIRVTVVKNSLARRALAGTKVEGLTQVIEGPSTMVYGGDSVVAVARRLFEVIKEIETVKVKGAVMDGVFYPADQVAALSKLPTKAEAQAQVVTLILSPARKVVAQLLAPGRKLASLVKALQEKQEKEGAAAPVAA